MRLARFFFLVNHSWLLPIRRMLRGWRGFSGFCATGVGIFLGNWGKFFLECGGGATGARNAETDRAKLSGRFRMGFHVIELT